MGEWWSDKTKLVLISTQVEVVVQVWLEKVLKINFHGWVAGWVVGKSDFTENPVVSLDLDLDFGLRLRVCQYNIVSP